MCVCVCTRWAKKVSPTDLSINYFMRKKSTVILHVHKVRNDSILYQVVCAASSLKYSMDTRMHQSPTRAISLHQVIKYRTQHTGVTGPSRQGIKYRTQAWKRITSDPSGLMPN